MVTVMKERIPVVPSIECNIKTDTMLKSLFEFFLFFYSHKYLLNYNVFDSLIVFS